MDTDRESILFMGSHQGRRFQKRVEEYQSGTWNEIEFTRFLYDDWNLIAEFGVKHYFPETYNLTF